VNVAYIAAVAPQTYRARHRDRGYQLGGFRKAELTLEALTRQGFNVRVVSSAVTQVNRLEWRRAEAETWHLPSGRTVEVRYPSTLPVRPIGGLLNSARAPWVHRRLLSDFRPDCVIAYNTYVFETLAALSIRRLSQVPILLQVEDLPLARRREFGNLKPWLDQQCWAPMLREAAGFTAVNQSILDRLPPGKPRRLLPGIIDDRLLQAAADRRPPFARREARTVGYFGGLTAEKGVRVLLEALESLPERWRLRVAGSGPMDSEFDALSRARPDRLEFLGNLEGSELYAALCSCDATVVPLEAITEGGVGVFPFKVLEYLIADTHIISTPLPGVGKLDLTFTQRWDGEVSGLINALQGAEAAYSDEYTRRLGAATLARSHFSVDGASRLFSELIQVATAGVRPREW
jgi:glycosyltransferase involved in cell wall biosynthesis